MAIISTPKYYMPMNMPIECVGNQNDITSVMVQVFCSSTSKQGPKTYEGRLQKKPNATYFGFDAQPYVDMAFLPVFSPDPNDTLLGVCPFTQVDVRMVTDSSILVYTSTHQVAPINLPFESYGLWLDGSAHGDFRIAKEKGFGFTYGTQYDDYIPSRLIYTFNERGEAPNKRVWNRSLMGAPRPIGFINLDDSNGAYWDSDVGVAVVVNKYGSKDSLKPDTSTYIQGVDGSIFSMPTLLLQFNGVSLLEKESQYISYVIEAPEVLTKHRETFIEQVNPTCLKMPAYQLYWLNRHGGYDWLIMEGKSTKTKTVERQAIKGYDRMFNGLSFSGDEKTLGSTNPTSSYWSYGGMGKNFIPKSFQWLAESQWEWQLNSTALTDWEWERVDDLFSSPVVFLWSALEDTLRAVEVASNSYQQKSFANDRMASLSITVKTINKEKTI